MYVPGLKERVCQRGLPGLFLVVWVDCDRQTADLIRLDTECAWLEEGVPFEELQPWQEARGFAAGQSLVPLVKRASESTELTGWLDGHAEPLLLHPPFRMGHAVNPPHAGRVALFSQTFFAKPGEKRTRFEVDS